ncbi:WD40-repeat-containing domain protein [Desarmillaria tabescens]|uniref:WD40-repeat-containing domain protein n=1 Tax=Armillaria tabescens TaxID=1929756 RepID=A0AA39U6V8_ARMTA|nr:WD40-repeat-containing domain protein [Desarmillaria tabescens]KAK0468195.1 WD40-repeat-containing domain protein [Desarmillaria tabescens]
MTSYSPVKTLHTPAHISSLAFGHSGHIFAGCDDGTLRVYDLSTFKASDLRDAWIACGTRVYLFQMDSPAMVLTPSDALASVENLHSSLAASSPKKVSQISLDASKTQLAFCTDNGLVGVVDLSSKCVSIMKTKHDNVCGCVKFIPDRPRELVSGGYDKALIHFDYMQENVLSRHDISIPPTNGSMSFSPPFVLCTALSATGVIAAGTADGHIWLGHGGMKVPSKGKKSRKWNGLDAEKASLHKLADGPVVALTFCDSNTLIFSTLLGNVTELRVNPDKEEEQVLPIWQATSKKSGQGQCPGCRR